MLRKPWRSLSARSWDSDERASSSDEHATKGPLNAWVEAAQHGRQWSSLETKAGRDFWAHDCVSNLGNQFPALSLNLDSWSVAEFAGAQ